MKLYFLIFAAVLAQETFAWKNELVSQAIYQAGSVAHHLGKSHIPVPFRQKRQLTCYVECIQEMTESIGTDFKETSNGLVNQKLFNRTKFDQLCRIYKEGKRCMDEDCRPSYLKKTLTAAFAALDYLCIDHYQEFIDNSECYASSAERIKDECSPVCGDTTQMAILKSKSEELKKRRTSAAFGQLSDVLGCMCTFLDCHVSCNTPIYEEVCDSEAPGEYIKDFSKTTFKALGKLMTDNNVGSLWPQSCRNIGNGAFGFAEDGSCVEDFVESDDNDISRLFF